MLGIYDTCAHADSNRVFTCVHVWTFIFPPHLPIYSAFTTGTSYNAVVFRQIKVLNATPYLYIYYSIIHQLSAASLVSVRTHEPFFPQILLAYQQIVVTVTNSTVYNYSNRYEDSRDGCNKRAGAIDQLHRRQAYAVLPHIRIHVQVDRRVCSAGRVLRRKVRLSRQVGRTSVLHWYVFKSASLYNTEDWYHGSRV